MNEVDFDAIERQLAIAIPPNYKTLFLARIGELQEIGCFEGDLSSLFTQAAIVIDYNLMERTPDAGTRAAFPSWWKTYFLIGTNGGGDFYSLKLDNSPEVWMIGSDCGDEPTRISSSLDNFVNELISDHIARVESKKRLEQEQARRREPFLAEFAAHRQAIDEAGGMAIAKDWFGATNSRQMFQALTHLPFKVSPRKLRLLGIAACKRVSGCQDNGLLEAATELAVQLTLGTASHDEVSATRKALRERREQVNATSSRWPVTAVHNLFQDDRDYLNYAAIYPHDPELIGVIEAVGYSLYGQPNGTIAESELFWEILGFPFLEVCIDPSWRTHAVMTIAAQIYATEDFSQMPKLAEALQEAGCDDLRLITHCQRTAAHVRGSWVIDLILGSEPNPFQREFTWDFECEHDKIDAEVLKQRLKHFGAARKVNSGASDDIAARLEFANWLQEQGDVPWAEYIRVRCALDDCPPGNDYVDLTEKQIECEIDLRPNITLQDFYASDDLVAEEWWSEESHDYYRGLQSLVHAVSPGENSAGPPSILVQRLHALMQQTPVRGVDFEEHYAEDIESIFASSMMSDLRFLSFENRSRNGAVSPVINALVHATFADELRYLSIQNGIRSDGEALLLASASFNRLRRLDMKYGKIACSEKAAESLMASSWFQQLGQLSCGIGDDCAELAMRELWRMPQLHSLALNRLPQKSVQAFSNKDPMTSLRRLAILQTELTGDACRTFCSLALPELITLCLSGCRASKEDLKQILAAPLTHGLQVLSVREPRLNESSLEVLARNPCASRLRSLELDCGDNDLNGKFRSLGSSALASAEFPALTTLKISYPYAAKGKTDMAQLLYRLVAPNLRHLTLEGCDFDDECAQAIGTNPSFSKLKRIKLSQSYRSSTLLSSLAAETMFRCENLHNLLEFELSQLALGDSISFLGDETVLPNLRSGSIWGSGSSDVTQERVKERRPIVYIGS